MVRSSYLTTSFFLYFFQKRRWMPVKNDATPVARYTPSVGSRQPETVNRRPQTSALSVRVHAIVLSHVILPVCRRRSASIRSSDRRTLEVTSQNRGLRLPIRRTEYYRPSACRDRWRHAGRHLVFLWRRLRNRCLRYRRPDFRFRQRSLRRMRSIMHWPLPAFCRHFTSATERDFRFRSCGRQNRNNSVSKESIRRLFAKLFVARTLDNLSVDWLVFVCSRSMNFRILWWPTSCTLIVRITFDEPTCVLVEPDSFCVIWCVCFVNFLVIYAWIDLTAIVIVWLIMHNLQSYMLKERTAWQTQEEAAWYNQS